MHLTIELPPDLEMQLREQARRHGKGLEQYVAGLIKDRAAAQKSKTQPLTAEETRLFEKINRGFTDEFWKRLRALDKKRRQAKLTEQERQELITMTEQLEAANVERLRALTELAAMKNMELDTLMKELGLSNGRHS
jgi:hypothetical protein